MSLTLGEKLRQAREARGISISEVAEQTRISALYLESIENNDYRGLPGGIFNKGFVKSYAKYVGIDDQEALHDYARLISEQGEDKVEETKTYKPEVLTDDRSSGSMLPTLIFAAIILGLGAWGIISLVNYLNAPKDTATANTSPTANKSANTSNNSSTNSNSVNANSANTTSQPMPSSSEIKVEFKALSETVALEATVDGKKVSSNVTVDTPQTFTGQQGVKLRYYRGFADKIQLTINGKQITPPAAPPKGNGIEYEINKDNIQQIWQSGAISLTPATPPNANTNTANANAANTASR